MTQMTGLERAKLLISYRGYNLTHIEHHDGWIDLLTTDPKAGTELLIRVVNTRVGVDLARALRTTLDTLKLERGILFGMSFTDAARRNLAHAPIEPFADHQSIVHNLSSTELYAQINAHIEALCVERCGQAPRSQADCEGVTKPPGAFSTYNCPLRHLSDNADIHYAHGWYNLLTADLRQVIALVSTLVEPDT